MNWNNVKLIFTREMRDQLRDRRTLVLIAVVPVLLYPLMGMTIFQLSQFLRNEAARVQVVGLEEFEGKDWIPPLTLEDAFHPKLFDDPVERKTLEVVQAETDEDAVAAAPISIEMARQQLTDGKVDVVLHFPPGFGERLQLARQYLLDRRGDTASEDYPAMLNVEVIANSTNEKARIAQLRVERVISHWRTDVMKNNLRASNLPVDATRPFEVMPQDVAKQEQRPRGHVVEDSAILAVPLGAYRCLLSSCRRLCGREGAWHARDFAHQPGSTSRNRLGQTAHGTHLQLADSPDEFGQPGLHRHVCVGKAQPSATVRRGERSIPPTAVGTALDVDRPGPCLGTV